MNSIKLSKEDIQKIVLGVLLGVGVVFGYFQWLLSPLQARHKTMSKNVSALSPAISRAKSLLARDADVRAQAPIAQATLVQINSMIPEGAPVAWFPTLVADFFKNQGIDKATTRMNSEGPHPSLPGYRRISWTVDLPKVECLNFGNAIASLENTHPLVSIDTIAIDSIREEPDAQHVVLTLSNIVKQ